MNELKCGICGKHIERQPSKIERSKKHYCSSFCRYEGQKSAKRSSGIQNGVVYLEITKGNVAMLDTIDQDLAGLNWQSQNSYVIRKDENRKYVYMHRIILERKLQISLERHDEVDHINGNRLDNRRSNLRLASHSMNCANMKKTIATANNNTSTIYKGVNYDKNCKKWRARITIRGVTSHLGYFDDEREAAIAYDRAAIQSFGYYAKLNFPDELYAWPIHRKSGCALGIKA